MRAIVAALIFTSLPLAAWSQWNPVPFTQIPSWQSQDFASALRAFKTSCGKGIRLQGQMAAYFPKARLQRACDAALNASFERPRAFFEQHFTPHRYQGTQQKGKITGYYIPLLRGALSRGGVYQWPVYAKPADFTQPYLSRAQIEAGALAGKGLELVWLDDPVMRFFLHVQGSGHVRLDDGRIITLQFAAKNGLPYTSIGKKLIEQGVLEAAHVSLQSIRNYLYENPKAQRPLFNQNASYIFFTRNDHADMPKGAQNVPLTPEHSLAIDPSFWPYGVPIYLEVQGKKPFARLVITQDTGSAIRGYFRADWFAGLGAQAEAKAGHLAAPANWVMLVPNR